MSKQRTRQTIKRERGFSWFWLIRTGLLIIMVLAWVLAFFIESDVLERIKLASLLIVSPWIIYALFTYGFALFSEDLITKFQDFIRSYRNNSAERMIQRRNQNKKNHSSDE
ncbi:MAG: hypothetical protein WBC91_06270 [Phototrophicaceae bacterium]